jgi:DNA-binding NtrC family response regulator
LAATFLKDCASRNGRPVHGITAKALRLLEAYRWPGNIRELRNVIERAVALCPTSHMGVADLPEALCLAASATLPQSYQSLHGEDLPPRSALRRAQGRAEAAAILEALRKHANNRLRAALELGISRRTLYKKLHRYGLMEASPSRSDWRSTNPIMLEEFTSPGKLVEHFS